MTARRNRVSAQDRRRQIISVAAGLFARNGYKGTTTLQIAQEARVNEAIIFRHFPRKEQLYWAVIEQHCCRSRGKQDSAEKLRRARNDRGVFTAIAEDLLQRDSKDVGLTRLLLFTALENHRLSHRFFRTHVARYYETLAEYIRKRIHEGAFRPMDPMLAARGFLGMVIYHILVQELFGGRRLQRYDAKLVSRTLTDIWLQGVKVSGNDGG